MVSEALHAASWRSTSCGGGWICTEMDAPASVISLESILCTPLSHARSDVHKKNPGRGRMGEPEPTGASKQIVLLMAGAA